MKVNIWFVLMENYMWYCFFQTGIIKLVSLSDFFGSSGVFKLPQPHFCVVISYWRYLFGRMPLNSSVNVVVLQETENERHLWTFKWPAAGCEINRFLYMLYACYNLPFSCTLSGFTWKSKKSLNSGVKSVLQAIEEVQSTCFLGLVLSRAKKHCDIKLCCAYRILEAERELLLCSKKKTLVQTFLQVLWSYYAPVGILGHLLLSCINLDIYTHRVSREECARLRENVP